MFHVPKEGSSQDEWEDGAVFGPAGESGSGIRFAVLDGATDGSYSTRWVRHLADSFMSREDGEGMYSPALERGDVSAWFAAMQEAWQATRPVTDSYIDHAMFARGTLATFVGGELAGLDGKTPTWTAAALGDVVLFHVRGGRLVTHFPPLRPGDFDLTPDGISTVPRHLERMSARLLFQQGRLAPGDCLFVATDALAEWLITAVESRGVSPWALLGSPAADPGMFTRLVDEGRQASGLKNDDVTLMRIQLVANPPSPLVVYG
jgi:hypothetical protein